FMASTIGEPRRGALDGTLARVTLVSGKGALGRLGSIPTRSRHLVHPSTNVGLKIQPGTPIQPTTCPGSRIPLKFAFIRPILRMRPGLRGPPQRAPSSRRGPEPEPQL